MTITIQSHIKQWLYEWYAEFELILHDVYIHIQILVNCVGIVTVLLSEIGGTMYNKGSSS